MDFQPFENDTRAPLTRERIAFFGELGRLQLTTEPKADVLTLYLYPSIFHQFVGRI